MEFRTYQRARGLEAYASVPKLEGITLAVVPSPLDGNAAYIEVVSPSGEALVLKNRKGKPGRISRSREPARAEAAR